MRENVNVEKNRGTIYGFFEHRPEPKVKVLQEGSHEFLWRSDENIRFEMRELRRKLTDGQ